MVTVLRQKMEQFANYLNGRRINNEIPNNARGGKSLDTRAIN